MGKLRGFTKCLFSVSTCWKLAQTSQYLLRDTRADVTEWKSLFPAKVFAGDWITRCHYTTVGKGSEQTGETEQASRRCRALPSQAAAPPAPRVPADSAREGSWLFRPISLSRKQ